MLQVWRRLTLFDTLACRNGSAEADGWGLPMRPLPLLVSTKGDRFVVQASACPTIKRLPVLTF